ncbi:HNH endonuclease [Cellulomonas triticagri]|uniref:HNH endonuclease n=1 Tax=Cellulomonas triticagri TaxID=2483352 RepID=UPI0011C362ED|nr:HNH endonuclease [Cellulomonas triticagri]
MQLTLPAVIGLANVPALAWLAVVVVLAAAVGARRRGRKGRRDPARWFDTGARAAGRALAGGRCEYPARWRPWRRCTSAAQQADHFYPWARGGATSMRNLVAACTAHNQTKGGAWPSWWLRAVITRRRCAYFPPGRPRRPGQRYQPR